jgi:hypothetical protein
LRLILPFVVNKIDRKEIPEMAERQT